MSTEKDAVKTDVQPAAAVEKTETSQTEEVDYEAMLNEKDVELAKLREEKENYRKGLLKAKGKLPEDDDKSSNDEDDKFRRIVREEMLTSREAQIQSEKDALIIASAKKVKELTLALKNRQQITNTSAPGSNQEKGEVKTDNFFSSEQINSLKAKGWSDKKIEEFKKNLAKGTQAK